MKENKNSNHRFDHRSIQPKSTNEDVKIALFNQTNTYIKTIDQELINPYTGMIKRKNENESRLFDSSPGNELNSPFNHLNEKSNTIINKTINKTKEEGIDIFNKFDDINNIIKNKTIITLNKIHHFNENTNNLETKNSSNRFKYSNNQTRKL